MNNSIVILICGAVIFVGVFMCLKGIIAVIAWVRCIGVLYSKPFENFIAPYTTEYRYKDIQTAMETSQWEQTVGTIILSEVFEEKNSDGITHKPLIEYTYTVHGTDYTGKTIYIGIWISINSKFSAKRFVSKYPVNQQVSVYYKPTQPQFSVLEPGVNKFTLYTL